LQESTELTGGRGQVTYQRAQLLPRLGVLAILHGLAAAIAYVPWVWFVGSWTAVLSTVYLAVIILRTRDVTRSGRRLHPFDSWICRLSGPLAVALAAMLLLGMSILMASNMEPGDLGLGSPWGLALVGLIMEVGVVLCVACLSTPRALQDVGPVVLWRLLAVPLLLIYGAYVVLLLVVPAPTL